MKKVFLLAHCWFGIVVGFYFVLLGITGSFLVYRDSLQAWLEPGVRRSSGVMPASVDLIRAVESAKAGLGVQKDPSRVVILDDPDRNLEISFSGLPGMGRGSITTFVDPATNEYRGKENFRETFGGQMFIFHHDLFLGGLGRTIMGVAGLVMLFILLSGLYLWWPRKISWSRALKLGPMRNPVQTQLELHKFFGFYTLLLMLMVTFSGVYISKPNWFQTVTPRAPEEGPKEELTPVDFARVQKALPPADFRPLDLRIDGKAGTLQITGPEGKVQRLSLGDLSPVAQAPQPPKDMRRIQRELHGGDFWGMAGEILVFVSGLLPLFFYVSGLFIWWKKSKNRRSTLFRGVTP